MFNIRTTNLHLKCFFLHKKILEHFFLKLQSDYKFIGIGLYLTDLRQFQVAAFTVKNILK